MNITNKCIQYIKTKIFKFDGETYDHNADNVRLRTQLGRVLSVMENLKWHTLSEISQKTADPITSISARLRDLRKAKFGSYVIERRYRGPKSDGLHEYRLILILDKQNENQSYPVGC